MKSAGNLISVVFTFLTLAVSAHAADDSPLFEAVKRGDKAAVEALLAKGADVNARDESGDTPLHVASGNGKKDIAELLLAKGADISAKNTYGQTPLHRPSGNDKKDIVELLLVKGADVNAKAKDTRTPLHWAASFGGTKDVAELLLSKGADVNAKTGDGRTPLHWAAYLGNKVVAELLLAKGADVNAKDTDGWTPLDWAARFAKKDVVELMENHILIQTKKPRELFGQLTQQLKSKPDDSTRRLILKLASEMNPAPAIPEEARKHFVEGTAMVKAAKNPAQQALAAQSFTEALKVAPWWGDAYYNLGVAQELAEQYDEAEKALTFYLFSNPGEAEKRDAQDRIYGIAAKRKLLGAK
jgi:ankyrin repeat protein